MKTYKDYIMEATFLGTAGYLSLSDYEYDIDAALALRYLRQYTKTESELNKILDFVKKNRLYHF